MDENPYRTPQFNEPAEKRELLPLWRRIVSIPLLIFGIGYLLDVPAVAVSFSLDGHCRASLMKAS